MTNILKLQKQICDCFIVLFGHFPTIIVMQMLLFTLHSRPCTNMRYRNVLTKLNFLETDRYRKLDIAYAKRYIKSLSYL